MKSLHKSKVLMLLLILTYIITLKYFIPLITNENKNTTKYGGPVIATPCEEMKKAIEKDLMDNAAKGLENFKTPFDFRNQRLIIYNKAAKCGSTTVENMMYRMAKRSEQYLQVWTKKLENMTSRDEKPIAASFSKGTASSQLPVVVVQQLPFVDFAKYGYPSPAYIQVIREPVARAISWYFHRMRNIDNDHPLPAHERNATLDDCLLSNQCPATSRTLNISLLHYFSGIEGLNENPDDSLKLAKLNIKKHFSLIGLTEMMPDFFQVLQYMHPDYFIGIVDLYNEANENHLNVGVGKHPLSEKALDVIKYRLRHSIELYKFIEQRFQKHLAQATRHIHIINLFKVNLKQCIPSNIIL